MAAAKRKPPKKRKMVLARVVREGFGRRGDLQERYATRGSIAVAAMGSASVNHQIAICDGDAPNRRVRRAELRQLPAGLTYSVGRR